MASEKKKRKADSFPSRQQVRADQELPIIIAGMMAGKKYYCHSHMLSKAACGKEVIGFRDRASAREFRVSGLCQNCQDLIFIEE